MTDSGVGRRIQQFSTARSFLERAKPWLLRAEAEHNLILGIAQELESGSHDYEEPILLATVEGPEGLAGCAFRTPPFKFGLTRVPEEAIPLLVSEAAALYSSLPAVMGPKSAAQRFAERWSATHGVGFEVGMRMRVFNLERVVPPTHPAPGRLRPATLENLELAIEWTRAFTSDTGVWGGDPGPLARRLISEGRLFFWEDRDSQPVCMAAGMAETPNGIRVGYVYTPPEARQRGYASACVAALSQHYLDLGRKFCFLYTDLANPTSNAIYQRMGYQPVCDVEDYNFS
jgi:predicted GNAT family acetyltransferase